MKDRETGVGAVEFASWVLAPVDGESPFVGQ